ncbi:hypothetical protein ELQ88_27865 [Pseudomonas sp. MPC6]|nr:hypothetical protein BZ163_19825 [Pseudomonas sp. VI4.1]QCY14290.1 hypothetical protein ELQ88_27865 [Pseudomonas sp. MPC6]
MRVKLQNFAKVAILAIAQQNCSIDDVSRCTKVGDTGPGCIRHPRVGVLIAFFKCQNVTVCDAWLTII